MRFVVGSTNGSRGRLSGQGTVHSLMTGGLSTTGVITATTTTGTSNAFIGPPSPPFAALRRRLICRPLLSRKHSPLQRGETPAYRAIIDPVADPHYYPAENLGVGAEERPHLAAERLGQPGDDLLLRGGAPWSAGRRPASACARRARRPT